MPEFAYEGRVCPRVSYGLLRDRMGQGLKTLSKHKRWRQSLPQCLVIVSLLDFGVKVNKDDFGSYLYFSILEHNFMSMGITHFLRI